MNKSAELAIAYAASKGVLPVVFYITEGAGCSSNPIETATHIHSIVFDNEQRWDEVNGWNLYVQGEGRSSKTITTEAQAKKEIRNIIKTAFSQYEKDRELNRERRLKQVRDVGLPDHHAFFPFYTGPSVEQRVEEGIISSPTLIDHPEALRWGREELVIHRSITSGVDYRMNQADEEPALVSIIEELNRFAAENTKAKKRFWQFLG